MGRSAVVAGATGLVGGELVKALAHDAAYDRVVALARRPVDMPPNVEVVKVDFDHLDEARFEADDAFCALGTTIKKAGSNEVFRRVDFDHALAFARAARASGTGFFLVSAFGADRRSRVFYNQVKGEIEAAIAALGFETCAFFRPSFLRGDRAERRVGEAIGSGVASVVGALPFSVTRRIRPVDAGDVARAMITLAKRHAPGVAIVESEQIPPLAPA